MATVLLLDEAAGTGIARHEAREHLEEHLARPEDPAEAEEFDRERWGGRPDQVAATDALIRLAGGQ